MTHSDLWRDMKERAWSPEQWFMDNDSPLKQGQKRGFPAEPNTVNDEEPSIMWVYQRTESGLWSVGWYGPDKSWHPESDWEIKEDAAKRVHWLNGGQGQVSAA